MIEKVLSRRQTAPMLALASLLLALPLTAQSAPDSASTQAASAQEADASGKIGEDQGVV